MRYFLFLYVTACLAVQTSSIEAHEPTYEGIVQEVGFDLLTVTARANIFYLGTRTDRHDFMGQAYRFKTEWQRDNITVQPLTLFLATAMHFGRKDLIILSSNKDLTKQLLGEIGEDKQDQTIHDAANKMAALLTSSPDAQVYLLPLSRAYLQYRLNPLFTNFERFVTSIDSDPSHPHFNTVLETLCGADSTTTARMLTCLIPDAGDNVMEMLSLKEVLALRLLSNANNQNVLRELKRRLISHITGKPADIAKNVDRAQAQRIGNRLPMLLGVNHPMLYRMKNLMIRDIRQAITTGTVITCDIPGFLKDSFRFEQLGAVAEEVLRAEVEGAQLDRAVMEHIKTRTIWGLRDEANSEEAKQKAAQRYASQYQVFSPLNPLAPVNTPYLIIREGYLERHKANLGVHFAAKSPLVMVVDYGDATTINRSPALPDSVRHISFVAPHVTTIGDDFLKDCTGLTSVDFSGLSELTTIEGYFLSGCRALKAVNLSGFRNVTKIGTFFLCSCYSLESVDLSGVRALTTIGNVFLSWSSALTSVDFSGQTALTTIGDDFLHRCTALEFVDFSGLTALTTIGDNFFSKEENAPITTVVVPTNPAGELIKGKIQRPTSILAEPSPPTTSPVQTHALPGT